MKNKLRLSYSLLTLWNNGRWEDSVKMYLHLETIKSKAMADGLELHEKWAKEITKNKRLKLGEAGFKFKNPKCEVKKIVSYNHRWDISGTFDILDGDTIYEMKSGVMSSLEYLNTYQLPLYFLIAEIAGIKVEKGVLIHYNQHKKETDASVLWNNKRQIEKAKNFIDSLAPEIEQYFVINNIPLEK